METFQLPVFEEWVTNLVSAPNKPSTIHTSSEQQKQYLDSDIVDDIKRGEVVDFR